MTQIFELIWDFLSRKKEPEFFSHDKLCRNFRNRYLDFQVLLRSNHRALEIMADMEKNLNGEIRFDISTIRSMCTTLLVNLFKMVQKLENLAPGKYTRLFDRLNDIQIAMTEILENDLEVYNAPLIMHFSDAKKDMAELLGNKMGTLCDIRNEKGIAVPDGFILTVSAYNQFMKSNDMSGEISRLLQSVNRDNMKELHRVSERIQNLIKHTEIPSELKISVKHAISKINNSDIHKKWFAVRSSATYEDQELSTFAGQYKTLLNISPEQLLD